MKYLGKLIATLHSRKLVSTTGVRMVSPRPSSDYAKFREYFQKAKHIVVMTGAGCSAESGIPTFRGAGGLWRTYNAQDLASPSAFERNPSLVWEFYSHRREVAASKEPNKAHIAIAECEERLAKQGRTVVVITQNIDELHRRAGSKNVIEIHGSLYKTRCTKCGIVLRNHNSPIVPALAGKGSPDPNATEARIPVDDLPKCGECFGLLRPDVVWFGESLNSDDLEKIDNHLAKCDLYLVVGTSAVVYPAAAFRPHDSRVPTAEFNLEDTPATSRFHFHFQGPTGETLPKAIGRHPTEPE